MYVVKCIVLIFIYFLLVWFSLLDSCIKRGRYLRETQLTPLTEPIVMTQTECEQRCASGATPCFGFTFRSQSQTCEIHPQYEPQLHAIGTIT